MHLHRLLRIDPRVATSQAEAFIINEVGEERKDGAIIGISGGIDSAVLSRAAVNALGGAKVRLIFMPEKGTAEETERDVELMCADLGIHYKKIDVSRRVGEEGVYDPLAVRLSLVSAFINKWLIVGYESLFGETAFEAMLRRGEGISAVQRVVYELCVGPNAKAFNKKHQLRREVLERYASDKNLLPLCAANKSERMVGWFIHDGIDDMPVSPLGNLYKTQVYDLAAYYHIPQEIINKDPSPDFMPGLRDDLAMGRIPYETIDLVLVGIEKGLSDEQMMVEGITGKHIRRVRRMMELSEWMRREPLCVPHFDSLGEGGQDVQPKNRLCPSK